MKTKDYYVYLHRKKTTGDVFYVGKGHANRAWSSSGRSTHWKSVVNKHGLVVEIVESNLQEWAAFELECALIALHGRMETGHGLLINHTDGGDGASGRTFTDVELNRRRDNARKLAQDPTWRALQSEGLKKMYAIPEYKAKHAEGVRKRSSNLEWRINHAEGMRKRSDNPDWVANMAKAALVRYSNPEWQASFAEGIVKRSGNHSWRVNQRDAMQRLHSNAEWRAKRKEALKVLRKPVVCIDTGEVFDGLPSAVEWLKKKGYPKASHANISATCSGKRNKSYGFRWKYVESSS
jgi:hypothetical protein